MLIEDYKQAHEIRMRLRIIKELQSILSDHIALHMEMSRRKAKERKLPNTEQFIDQSEQELSQLLEAHFQQISTELKEEFKAI
jgi:hypothetical protein